MCDRHTIVTTRPTLRRVPHVPASPCATPGCPHLRPCPTHPIIPWADSKQRRAAKTTGLTTTQEQRRRRRILRIHRGLCHICHHPLADEVDHVIPLAEDGPDTDDNLRPIHSTPCHKEKTKAEAARGRARARARRTG